MNLFRPFQVKGWCIGFFLCLVFFSAGSVCAQVGKEHIRWSDDIRLTHNAAEKNLSFNFARGLAADEEGRVHAVWMDQRDDFGQVYYIRSIDRGFTWGEETRISDLRAECEHPAIALVGNNLYVVWHSKYKGRHSIVIRKSEDGGATWLPQRKLSNPLSDSRFPSVAVTGEDVYITCQVRIGQRFQVVIYHSPDGGVTWLPEKKVSETLLDSWTATVTAIGEKVFIAWVDLSDGNEEVYFRRSLDRGETSDDAVRLTNDPADSWASSIVASSDEVALFWFDRRDGEVQPLDPERRLDEGLKKLGQRVEPIPGGVYAPHPESETINRIEQKLEWIDKEAPIWVEKGGDASELESVLQEFDLLSASNALSASAEQKLDEAYALLGLLVEPFVGSKKSPVVRRSAFIQRVKAIHNAVPDWIEKGGDPKEIEALLFDFDRLSRRGVRYEVQESKLDQALELMGLPTDIPLNPKSPQKTKNAPLMYYMEAQKIRTSDKIDQILEAKPAWVAGGGKPEEIETYLSEFRSLAERTEEGWEIYTKRSGDGGATWDPDQRLTSAIGVSQRPTVARAGEDLYLAWMDNRDGNFEIYFKHSADAGKTWGDDVRLTEDDAESSHPMIAVGKGRVHVLWVDHREGYREIYYKQTLSNL